MPRQNGLPHPTDKPTLAWPVQLGMVARVYPKAWRCDVRDVVHSEKQVQRAMVIGALLPPEHRPTAQEPIESFVLYGFNGGRRQDAWCIPIHNTMLTNDEREANSFFLRLLGVTVRIGKLDSNSDDIVYEVSGGNAIVRVNVTNGNILVQGADGSAKAEIEEGGRIHFKAKSGMTVDADDGTGPVALAKLSELQALISTTNANVTAYGAHKHADPVSGSTGPPDTPMSTASSATGTEVLRGK